LTEEGEKGGEPLFNYLFEEMEDASLPAGREDERSRVNAARRWQASIEFQ